MYNNTVAPNVHSLLSLIVVSNIIFLTKPKDNTSTLMNKYTKCINNKLLGLSKSCSDDNLEQARNC